MSKFARNLQCEVCGQRYSARFWPVNGDRVPFYFEREPSKYSVQIHCPTKGTLSGIVLLPAFDNT